MTCDNRSLDYASRPAPRTTDQHTYKEQNMKQLPNWCARLGIFFAAVCSGANACTLTSQVDPSLKIVFTSTPNYAFFTGTIFDGTKKIESLGEWVCSTGGTCGYDGGTVGSGSIVGLRNGRPTGGTSMKPTAYLFPDLSLGDKWNARLRMASRGLWLRGGQCTGYQFYDFP